MADAYSLLFSGDQVGLIVRGKKSHAHKPDVMEQHADCILSNGAPVGFFGEGNNGSSNSIGMGKERAQESAFSIPYPAHRPSAT
jgi:hypothetical protein